MGTFIAYFRKEVLESSRQSKYLILIAFFGFFAIANPIMLRLLPHILESQMPGFPPELMQFDAAYSVQNYMKSIYQLGNMVIAFTLMGILAEERTRGKLVFPVSQGASLVGLVLAKLAHYVLVVAGITFVAMLLNYYYSVVLFPEGAPGVNAACISAALLAAYFATRVVVVTLASAWFSRPLAAGLTALVISYLEPLGTSLPRLEPLLPYSLINVAGARLSTGNPPIGSGLTSGTTAVDGQVLAMAMLIETIVMVLLTIWRMHHVKIIPTEEHS